jgi:hypothetical protein
LIKEKETAEGAEPPRVMALDDYFTTDGKVSCQGATGTVFNYCRYLDWFLLLKLTNSNQEALEFMSQITIGFSFTTPLLCSSTLSLLTGSVSNPDTYPGQHGLKGSDQ